MYARRAEKMPTRNFFFINHGIDAFGLHSRWTLSSPSIFSTAKAVLSPRSNLRHLYKYRITYCESSITNKKIYIYMHTSMIKNCIGILGNRDGPPFFRGSFIIRRGGEEEVKGIIYPANARGHYFLPVFYEFSSGEIHFSDARSARER